ncbi:MAG: DnaD domain-containing protein [Thermomicrobiales bacterium]
MTSRSVTGTPRFAGFNAHQRGNVVVPAAFFTELLPEISDINELRVLLALIRLVSDESTLESPLPETRILQDRALLESVRVDGITSRIGRQTILHGLELLIARGVVLRVAAENSGRSDSWYFLHTPVTREFVEAIRRGAISPPRSMWTEDQPPSITADPPTPFLLYEQNIGPLTPMVADRITRAIQEYPAAWIEDAIEEAVAYNRRNWKYIEAILESWTAQGRSERS